MLAQWKDVHVDEGEWHIPIEISKTGKPDIVYLSIQAPTLFKELKPLAGSSDWVLQAHRQTSVHVHRPHLTSRYKTG
ncbi:hypothetical protein SAMN05216551_10571 [Chitinasiproducens palmae]|uniref:Uncharacterized protein n=1 Tax=Chitinasiproducens palmae TaxID=1770053 RepID=A0A1H2PPZ3_9BURK|nr:hypothetical protein SAMN05216551_10571 [Chitinasiproducens palmae]